MIKKLLLPLMTLALVVWSVGCSNDSALEPTDPGQSLDEEFGGLTPIDESPAFNDPELLEEAAAEEAFDDPILLSGEVDTLIEDPESGYYHMNVVWGKLRYDSTQTTLTDWTGSLTISRGAEVIRRVIRFELGQDYIPTRTDRQTVDWVSYTSVHNDGISIDLVIPKPEPIYDTTIIDTTDSLGDTIQIIVVDTTLPVLPPVTVAFETGPYSRTFSLDELAQLDTVVYLDDSNAVAFHALKLDRHPCPRGFLAGAWGVDAEGEGYFIGFWMSRRGFISGYLRGFYGENEVGDNVFYGKWINRTGEFEGFLAGTYGSAAYTGPFANRVLARDGWFAGHIYNAAREEIGVLKGRFRGANSSTGGFFQGRWYTYCGYSHDGDPEAGEAISMDDSEMTEFANDQSGF